jgi:acylphosphatase
MVAKHIIYKGNVQGVGFRYTSQRIANRHHLTGYVKNLPEGSVEMLAQGKLQDVDDCIEEIQESFGGYIRLAQMNEVPPNPGYTSFNITF